MKPPGRLRQLLPIGGILLIACLALCVVLSIFPQAKPATPVAIAPSTPRAVTALPNETQIAAKVYSTLTSVAPTAILEQTLAPTPLVQNIAPSETSAILGIVRENLRVRQGPGTTFAVIGSLKQGETVAIIGKNEALDWFQIDRGWVAATFVDVTGNLAKVPVKQVAQQTAIPTSATTTQSTPIVSSQCPQGCMSELPGCAIKGNISNTGEKIYHRPGDQSYKQTKIDPSKGERWFCSSAEAEANGWRQVTK